MPLKTNLVKMPLENYSRQRYGAEILSAKCYWKNAVCKILGAYVADKILLGKC